MIQYTIPCIYLNRGIACKGFHEDESASVSYLTLAKEARKNALQLLLFDKSKEDESHDRDIEAIRQICLTAAVPVIGAGNVKRLEDVKKLLYAGCEKAVLNFAKESNIQLLEEASKRFGKDKIAVYLPSESAFERSRQNLYEYASRLICTKELAAELRSKTDMGILAVDHENACAEPIHYNPGLESTIAWEELKTNANGLIPCIVQSAADDTVLMLAYMNEEAFAETLRSRRMTYWSRSRNELWKKGLTSGHFQFVQSISYDCDQDTLLARVIQIGAACHTGHTSCFFRMLTEDTSAHKNASNVLEDVYEVIEDRKRHPKEGSYTNYLFDKGIDKILKKLGEEATEIIIAAKNPDPQESVYEISDFLYHAMILMAEKGISWKDVLAELANR